MPGPLDGVKVVELGQWVAGPSTAAVLADWGADVVKVEPPSGDPARDFFRFMGGEVNINVPFELDNRSKRSIAVELSRPEGRELVIELLLQADALVTNFRIGALERLGLAYDQLAERCPQLVYCALTGYGVDGPERDRAAYDVGAFWSRAGIAGLLTPPGGEPPFQRGAFGDHSIAVALAGGISAALVARQKSGRGQLVSTSLLRWGAWCIAFDLQLQLRVGRPVSAMTHEAMGNPLMNWFADRDGRRFWLIGLDSERHWPDLARAVDHPEWIDDRRFVDVLARRDNCELLNRLLDEAFATRTRDEWAKVLDAEGMWWSPIQDVEEVIADPQLWANGGFVEVQEPSGAAAVMVASPIDFRDTPQGPRATAPELGADTDDVLAELGRTPDEIAALRADGIVA